MPPQRLSSSWFSGQATQRLRRAAAAHSSTWRLPSFLMSDSSTGIAPACRAAACPPTHTHTHTHTPRSVSTTPHGRASILDSLPKQHCALALTPHSSAKSSATARSCRGFKVPGCKVCPRRPQI
eukprot:2149962-Rhodomonas_salina.2